MKRWISMVLVSLLIAVFAGPVQAAGSGSDVDGHWAEQDVLRMHARGLIEGDGQGNYFPERFISREEVITMLVRFNGQDTEARQIQPVNNPQGKISNWAVGYLSIAQQNGWITRDELNGLSWKLEASRQEAFAWLSKALQITPVYNDTEQVLEQFKDYTDISSILEAYLIPLVKEKIVIGDNGYFCPKNPIKRAEVAAILNRVDGKYMLPGVNQLRYAQILAINPQNGVTIVLQSLQGQQYRGYVRSNTPFYAEGRKISRDELSVGQWVDSFINQSDDFVYIERIKAADPSLATTVNAKASRIDWDAGMMEVAIEGSAECYRLSPAVLKQTDSEVNRIKAGDQVILGISNGQIISMSCDEYKKFSPLGFSVYKGVLSSVDTQKKQLTLKENTFYLLDSSQGWKDNENGKTMDIDSGALIYKSAEKISLNRLDDYPDYQLYMVYDQKSRKITQIRVNEGEEQLFKDLISKIDINYNRIIFKDNVPGVVYDQSTIIFDQGSPAGSGDLKMDQRVLVVIDRHNNMDKAAVIIQ